ncbi:MAG: tRNA-dihydrouridine synthase family protein [Candidatus Acididesulfobacter diazotrophicus]|jgi:nifR3 family TIM-barrel protein|uniref:tRNA-dihydrouridine synthase family protein n=1 Tax=Candidatus Acididesulfobacter diazotrophicus TaxID=2597226 RepID=A0A519BK58_9DELT|nr:MAG: tRNA-dihydrouridine synthase family protein [Candidatus Acididesulfobacter diazotrophicus]
MSKPYIIGDCILAPMAGITGYPFRKIALKYGASFCFTEMISAIGYINNDKSTLELAYSGSYSANTGIQIFGSDPYIMGLAAKKATQSGFKTIDINFGCPAKKVIKTGAGSAVLKDLDKFKAIIAEVKNNIGNNNILTIKLRSGFDESSKNYLESCKIAENEGVDAIFFHPRTRSQMFSGKADHSLTTLLKKSLSIPVYATGDILDVSSAKKIKENTAADGVMFARGAIGKPWIFQDFRKYTDKKYKEQKSQYKYLNADNQKIDDQYLDAVGQKSADNKYSDSDIYLNLDKIAELFEEMTVFYGEKKSANLIKPHLYNFITGFENAKLYRFEVNNARSYNDIINIFKNINI